MKYYMKIEWRHCDQEPNLLKTTPAMFYHPPLSNDSMINYSRVPFNHPSDVMHKYHVFQHICRHLGWWPMTWRKRLV